MKTRPHGRARGSPCHPGAGAFVPGESDEPADDHRRSRGDDVSSSVSTTALQPIDDTPGYIYLTQTRGLPLRPEDQAQLRWVADYRGDEGALLAPVTDDDGKLVRLLVTHVTPDGCKSQHEPARITIRGAKRLGLFRLGSPATKAIETEGIEKGLAARAAGAEYVVVSGGAANLGKVPLPPSCAPSSLRATPIPPVRPPIWRCGAAWCVASGRASRSPSPRGRTILRRRTRRRSRISTTSTRYDPELVPVLLDGANLEHGRLGDAVDNAILDAASRLDAIQLGRARKSIAGLLMTSLGGLDDKLSEIIRKRVADARGRDGRSEAAPLAGPRDRHRRGSRHRGWRAPEDPGGA